MSTSLRASDITVSFGPAVMLDHVSLTVEPGERWGVVGPNGVGKSTLLRTLAGLIAPDSGQIIVTPHGAMVGYLSQEPERRADETVRAYLARRTGVTAASDALDATTAAMAAGDADAGDAYSVALDTWLALGGADLDARIGKAWDELGLNVALLERPMSVLSGGEAARAGLAALILSRFDVYLLDEPTNDLDLDGLARLENFVTSISGSVVLVSHDRTFLERTITHVVELDEFKHTASTFAGGWTAYLTEREVARKQAWTDFEEYDSKRSDLAGRSQREREWATQGVSKAKKKPNDGDKIQRNLKMNSSEQLAGKAARTDKQMERLVKVEKPREAWQLRLEIPLAARGGDVVARLAGAEVDYDSFHLGPIELQVSFGDRIAIVGHNGSGKSTLIGSLLGRIPLSSGSQWMGPGVVIGELEQARNQLAGRNEDGTFSDATLLEVFMAATGLLVPEARTLLAKFNLAADHVNRPAASLSPGERTRGVLALLMANGANCLVLDEPTNHLDLPAIEQLEQALDTFGGTVLLVTHDRSLLNSVRITRTVTLEAGRIVSDLAT
jgi:ATPase subunit of ABC transporter with duplicated ATPase domains